MHKYIQAEYKWFLCHIIHWSTSPGIKYFTWCQELCGSFFTGFDFFLCFYQVRRRKQCFISLYKLKMTLGKFFSSQKSAKIM